MQTTTQLAPRAKKAMADLAKKANNHMDAAKRTMSASERAMAGAGMEADASGQLLHQQAEERMDMALTAISKMQQLGATEEDLAPLWERVLEAQQA